MIVLPLLSAAWALLAAPTTAPEARLAGIAAGEPLAAVQARMPEAQVGPDFEGNARLTLLDTPNVSAGFCDGRASYVIEAAGRGRADFEAEVARVSERHGAPKYEAGDNLTAVWRAAGATWRVTYIRADDLVARQVIWADCD